jgi:hypothetical protein
MQYPERGRAGTGAVLSLSAVGPQEKFLSNGKTDDSFFNPNNVIKHTNFSTQFRNHIIQKDDGNPTWPFDKEIIFRINPKTSGDVLSNAFLKCELPQLVEGNAYCQQVGFSMIKEIKLKINESTIDKITGDWLTINKELFLKSEETNALKDMVGGEESISPTTSTLPLYIPLNLFFCRDRTIPYDKRWLISDDFFKPYLLLCACWNNEINISIKFQPISFFSNVTSDISMPNLNVVTIEHSLTDNERLFYQTNKQLSLINSVTNQAVLPIEKNQESFKNFLSATGPVKSFHWFFRNSDFENSSNSDNFLKRFNFSSNHLSSNILTENSNVIMADAKIFIGGSSGQIGFQGQLQENRVTGHGYYKFLQTFDHHLQNPDRNIYTYSFSIDPANPSPTGAIDFGLVKTSKTILQGTIYRPAQSNSYNLHLFYTGYKVLKYENGFASLVFS